MLAATTAAAACSSPQGANGPAIEPLASDEPAAAPSAPPESEPAAVERDGTHVSDNVIVPAPVIETVFEVAGCDGDVTPISEIPQS